MSNGKKQSTSSGGDVAADPTSLQMTSGWLAFSLVMTMLIILGLLIVMLVLFSASNSNNVEFSKWALTTLLGTFGAWIGAGAAYFFGRENLNESSRSTAEALRIQQEALRGVPKPERIGEIALTTMDKDFMFTLNDTKKDVIKKLQLPQYSDYWWVPVLDDGGKLVDCFHARLFWDNNAFANDAPLSKIISDIDSNPNLKALHGASFFVQVGLDNEIADVIGDMKKSGAAIGIIVDKNGKPNYCFSKQDLLNVQK